MSGVSKRDARDLDIAMGLIWLTPFVLAVAVALDSPNLGRGSLLLPLVAMAIVFWVLVR